MEKVFEDFEIPKDAGGSNIENYVKIVCTLFDIPIHINKSNQEKRSLIEAVHLFFSLFLEFKGNKHFQKEDDINNKIKDQNVMKFT
jgi:hypothetical protein